MAKPRTLSGANKIVGNTKSSDDKSHTTINGQKNTKSSKKGIGAKKVLKTAGKESNKVTNPRAKAGSKRAHSAIGDDEDKENQGIGRLEIDDDDARLKHVTDDCDQVRERIEHYICRGEMTVSEFVEAIGVNRNSYLTFMDHDGPQSGDKISTYEKAWRFFRKRELLRGISMPPLKSAKRDKDCARLTASSKSISKPPKKGDLEKYDVSGILLDGEENGEVEIYETCDSMRLKVAEHLEKDDVVQASFLREVSKCFGNNPMTINAAQMRNFMSKHGAHSGSSSAFFYGAYVYFEKLCIKNGEEKSEFREDMEDIWEFRLYQEKRGFPRKGNQAYIVGIHQKFYEDEYGQPVVL